MKLVPLLLLSLSNSPSTTDRCGLVFSCSAAIEGASHSVFSISKTFIARFNWIWWTWNYRFQSGTDVSEQWIWNFCKKSAFRKWKCNFGFGRMAHAETTWSAQLKLRILSTWTSIRVFDWVIAITKRIVNAKNLVMNIKIKIGSIFIENIWTCIDITSTRYIIVSNC